MSELEATLSSSHTQVLNSLEVMKIEEPDKGSVHLQASTKHHLWKQALQ